jgi:hypothetical protein
MDEITATPMSFQNEASLFIMDHKLTKAAPILISFLKHPLMRDGIPQVGTPLYALNALVEAGYQLSTSELALVATFANSASFEASAMANMVLDSAAQR